MFTIHSEQPKLDISVQTLDDLKKALRYLNPLLFSIAKGQLMQKYNIHIDGLGTKIHCAVLQKKPITLTIVYVNCKGEIIDETTSLILPPTTQPISNSFVG